MRALTTICLLILPIFIFAQNDFAVTSEGDTLHGKLKKGLFGPLRIVNGSDDTPISADKISLYYRSKQGEIYCSKTLPETSRPTFIERLENGKIKLYSHIVTYNNGTSSFSVTTWYAEKDGVPLGEVKTSALRGGKQDRKEFFQSLISDDAALTEKFSKGSFTFSNLREIVTEYNKK